MHAVERVIFDILIQISLRFVTNGSIQNSLVSVRRRDIAWTNDDPVAEAYMRHQASTS